MTTTTQLSIVATILLAAAAPAVADGASATASSSLHVDAEIDPTAYVLDGFSLHLGLGRGRVRLDLGVFALQLPHAVDGDDGFTSRFDGYGAKLQYFLFDEQRGGFVGVDASVDTTMVQLDGTDLASRHTQVGVGVNGGWRFAITERLYATAWLGVGRTLNAVDVTLADRTHEVSRWTVFPAVHLGYRFQ